MQISREADYALRAVVYLSRLSDGQRAATSKIASEQQIPAAFLAKIVVRLSAAGLIHTSRGARGGVSLARPSDQISMLEVIEVIDGPILVNSCVLRPDECSMSSMCSFRPIFCEAQETLVGKLKSTTLAQLA